MSEKRYELDVRMDMPKLLIDNNTNEKYNLLMVNENFDDEEEAVQFIKMWCD